MDKKIFYLVTGVLAVLLVILVVTVSMLGSRSQKSEVNINPEQLITPIPQNNEFLDSTDSEALVEPNQNENSPENTAKSFYEWYTTTKDPLGSGAYKTNPLISDYFQATLDGFVLTNDHLTGDPVLACVEVRLIKNLNVQPAEFDQSSLKASVVLDDLNTGGASYKVILSNINNNWQVDDVRCNL